MLVVIRGAGDIATGIALRLWRARFRVVMTDLERPTAIRRTVCFSQAIPDGETTVEDVTARRAEGPAQALELLDGVLEDVDSDSAAKQQAVEEASAIAQNILAESNVESLLEAKGYTDCVAYITAQECSVVLAGAVEEADTLIVQEVVMEQTGLTADKIKIIGTN